MKRFVKRAAAFFAAAVMVLTAASCGEDAVVGNLGEVKREDKENEVYAVISIREFGDITAKLFPTAAPNAVQRFTENAERGYYDGTTIHRVIPNYIIQGGSLNGDGSDGNVPENLYLPVETTAVTYNFYGALCLAASKKGCYSQFYIVNNHEPQDIDAVISKLSGQLSDEAFASRLLEEDKKKYQEYLDKLKAIPEEVKEKYKRVGGLYDLDGTSTVMGQVIDGFDVMKAISQVEVVSGNKSDDKQGKYSKPLEDIIIDHVEIIKIEPEVTTEATTTKKAGRTKKTSEEVNAESLPASDSSDDTTAPSDDATADAGDTNSASDDTTADAGDANATADDTTTQAQSSDDTASASDDTSAEVTIVSADDSELTTSSSEEEIVIEE